MFWRKKQPEPVDPTLIVVAHGHRKDLLVHRDHLTLRLFRDGKKRKLHSEKSIRLSAVNSVQLRQKGRVTAYYLQIGVTGENPPSGRHNLDTALDENTIWFSKQQLPEFEEAKRAIEAVLFV